MSWQAYIDSSLLGTGKIDKAGIYSRAGDSTWAKSSNFTVRLTSHSNHRRRCLKAIFENTDDFL